MVKVSLSEQIHEAEVHRDALQKAATDKPELAPRLHRAEALLLTLSERQAFDEEWQEFMTSRQEAEGRRVSRGFAPDARTNPYMGE